MDRYAAVINDLSGLGRCSLVADISVLAAMGISPCPIPSAVLTNQTEYAGFFMRDMSGDLHEYLARWPEIRHSFSGILTGFFTNAREADFALSFIRAYQKPGTLVLVDPVLADEGETYSNYSNKLLEKMRELIRNADIITPNLSELSLLAGINMRELIEEAASWRPAEKNPADGDSPKAGDGDRRQAESKGHVRTFAGPEMVVRAALQLIGDSDMTVVTTGIGTGSGTVGNLCVTRKGSCFFGFPRIGGDYSGAGDLLAAAVLGGRIRGFSWEEIMNRFGKMFGAAALDALREGGDPNDGLPYEKYLGFLGKE